ncbi:MAG: hypothetical protein KC589_03320 [Nanoarchaeota archaeon]|nr:hypothetical protein [Nanoarchaeota archaeon]
MHYTDHALLSAKKFNCNKEDVLFLHKIMDSSKNHFVNYMHRMFSHNTWFISVVTDLVGDTIPNTKTGEQMSTRDILYEHLREDLNGECPTIKDWVENINLNISPKNSRWINSPNRKDLELLKQIKNDRKKAIN